MEVARLRRGALMVQLSQLAMSAVMKGAVIGQTATASLAAILKILSRYSLDVMPP